MITISKTFDFDAAHFLPKVPKGHKCRRLHGHTYRVEVVCATSDNRLDKRGMVLDYAEIAEAWKVLDAKLDHRCLNKIKGLENPTTEVLAPWIFDRLWKTLCVGVGVERSWALIAVKVYESSTTWCEYRP